MIIINKIISNEIIKWKAGRLQGVSLWPITPGDTLLIFRVWHGKFLTYCHNCYTWTFFTGTPDTKFDDSETFYIHTVPYLSYSVHFYATGDSKLHWKLPNRESTMRISPKPVIAMHTAIFKQSPFLNKFG